MCALLFFSQLRERRPICNPNTGFTFQLLLLQRRLGISYRRFDEPLSQSTSNAQNLQLTQTRATSTLRAANSPKALRETSAKGDKNAETPTSPPRKTTERKAPAVQLLRLSIHSARAPDFLLWSGVEGLEALAKGEGLECQEERGTAKILLPALSSRGAYLLLLAEEAWLWFDMQKCLRPPDVVLEEARKYLQIVSLVEGRAREALL